MSCSITLKRNRKICMGADKLVINNPQIKHYEKILQSKPYIIGFTGKFKILHLFEQYLLNKDFSTIPIEQLCTELSKIIPLHKDMDSCFNITNGIDVYQYVSLKNETNKMLSDRHQGSFIIGEDSGIAAARKYLESTNYLIDDNLSLKDTIREALQAAHDASPENIGDDFTILEC